MIRLNKHILSGLSALVLWEASYQRTHWCTVCRSQGLHFGRRLPLLTADYTFSQNFYFVYFFGGQECVGHLCRPYCIFERCLSWNFRTVYAGRNRVGIGLSYRPTTLHGWWNRFLGINSSDLKKLKNTVSGFGPRELPWQAGALLT